MSCEGITSVPFGISKLNQSDINSPLSNSVVRRVYILSVYRVLSNRDDKCYSDILHFLYICEHNQGFPTKKDLDDRRTEFKALLGEPNYAFAMFREIATNCEHITNWKPSRPPIAWNARNRSWQDEPIAEG